MFQQQSCHKTCSEELMMSTFCCFHLQKWTVAALLPSRTSSGVAHERFMPPSWVCMSKVVQQPQCCSDTAHVGNMTPLIDTRAPCHILLGTVHEDCTSCSDVCGRIGQVCLKALFQHLHGGTRRNLRQFQLQVSFQNGCLCKVKQELSSVIKKFILSFLSGSC